MAVRECPMCGEIMRLCDREVTERLPGTAQSRTTQFREWVCPECDYFEEAEELAKAE
jgi:acetone carboxylase gamma subunit